MMSGESLNINDRRRARLIKFEENKVAVQGCVSSYIKRYYLHGRSIFPRQGNYLAELFAHNRRAADRAMQYGLIQQHFIGRGIFSAQYVLPAQPRFDPLLQYGWVNFGCYARDDRPRV